MYRNDCEFIALFIPKENTIYKTPEATNQDLAHELAHKILKEKNVVRRMQEFIAFGIDILFCRDFPCPHHEPEPQGFQI